MAHRVVFERRHICFIEFLLAWWEVSFAPLGCQVSSYSFYNSGSQRLFSQMTPHSQLLTQVQGRSLTCPHLAAPPQRKQRSTPGNLRSFPKFYPPMHQQCAFTFQSDCSPTTSPQVLKPSIFLSYFSILSIDVDRWEGPSDDADARLHFGVCSPQSGSRWRGRSISRRSCRCLTSMANIVDNVCSNLFR